MWYEWDSLELFNAWHQEICTSLGIPDELTTAYTVAYSIEDKFIAFVEDQHSEGLTPTDLTLPKVIRD
tara:strand:+ start:4375 stop:4578 length:204 start_codon:yes stop_codon:yes gene_type:complete